MLGVQAVFYSSTFFNCLPFGTIGGDVARVWLARKFPLSIRQIVLSVLLDRIITVAALMILALLTLPSIAHPLAAMASFACAAILISGILGFLLLQPITRLLGRWRDQRFINSLINSAEELRVLSRHGGLKSLGYALASASCAAFAAYCIAHSLSISVSVIQMTAVISIVIFYRSAAHFARRLGRPRDFVCDTPRPTRSRSRSRTTLIRGIWGYRNSNEFPRRRGLADNG